MVEAATPLTADEDLDVAAERLYRDLGTRPVINAAGAYTLLGGSVLSPGVRAAMDAANYRFSDMRDLLDAAGRRVAEMLGVEAAYVTSGAAGALVLAVAACLTLDHPEYVERLPDTSGIPNEVVVQRNLRQRYDRCLSIPGARIVEAGDERGMTLAQLSEAIRPSTAAVFYLAPARAGAPPIEAVIEVCQRRNLPLIVDAAGLTYPVEELSKYARLGADLVCYAGKYFDAPQSTGLLLGRNNLVEAAARNGFVAFEREDNRAFGRPMKLDRQEVFGCVVALREWLAMDHEARFAAYGRRIGAILDALRSLPVEAYRISERETPAPTVRDGVRIHLDSPAAAARLVEALRDGEPCIWTRVDDRDPAAVNLSVAFLRDGDEHRIARSLKEALIGSR